MIIIYGSWAKMNRKKHQQNTHYHCHGWVVKHFWVWKQTRPPWYCDWSQLEGFAKNPHQSGRGKNTSNHFFRPSNFAQRYQFMFNNIFVALGKFNLAQRNGRYKLAKINPYNRNKNNYHRNRHSHPFHKTNFWVFRIKVFIKSRKDNVRCCTN